MAGHADLLTRAVAWRLTNARVFVYAAWVDRQWWVLRLNEFPDHPLFTLFIAGACIGDVQDLKIRAPGWDLDVASRSALTGEQRSEVLTLMRGLGPYGSEVGDPCDGDWCRCYRLTDEYVRAGAQGWARAQLKTGR